MAKFDIKTVKPKFVVTTSPENKIDVVVNKPIITSKNTKSFFQLKNTGGPKGVKGDKGEPGQDSTIEVVSTTTGAAGTNASVVNQGTASAAQLAFTIPRGDKGDKGDDGAAGYSPTATVSKSGDTATITITDKNGTTTASISDGQDGAAGAPGQSATIAVDSTSTLPAGSPATVTNVGTQSAARLAFGIPKGDTGAAGADGDAATITVGQVETLAPNQPAYVNNVGTTSAAIFNIGIPKGDKGDSGSGTGDMLASTYDPNGDVAAAGGIPDYVAGELPTVNDATLTIQKNGTTVNTFTANSSSNVTANITVPTQTSDLTNNGSDGTSTYVEADDLATVATSGDYNDLLNQPTIPAAQVNSDWNAVSGVAQILNKPTIPTVNDAILTITQNGTSAGTFTANASSNTTIALTDTTYSAMTGATSGAAGTSGLVPAPAAGDNTKFLQGDGTWATPNAGGVFDCYVNKTLASTWTAWNIYDSTSYTTTLDSVDISNQLLAGKRVVVHTSDSPSYTFEIISQYDDSLPCYDFIVSFGGVLKKMTYSKLSGWWSFPSDVVNDATLTIQHNGTTVDTFSANASANKTVNIETIYADTITPTTAVATIGTTQIADGAVTSAKVDWSSITSTSISVSNFVTAATGYSIASSNIYKTGNLLVATITITKSSSDIGPGQVVVGNIKTGFRPRTTANYFAGLGDNEWSIKTACYFYVNSAGDIYINNQTGVTGCRVVKALLTWFTD